MIRILGKNKEGDTEVEVVDYFRESHGYSRFSFRPIADDETTFMYFDRIMNKYWYITGKNKRRYHEL